MHNDQVWLYLLVGSSSIMTLHISVLVLRKDSKNPNLYCYSSQTLKIWETMASCLKDHQEPSLCHKICTSVKI